MDIMALGDFLSRVTGAAVFFGCSGIATAAFTSSRKPINAGWAVFLFGVGLIHLSLLI